MEEGDWRPIFEGALELPPEERAAWLEEACGGDEGLRRAYEWYSSEGML